MNFSTSHYINELQSDMRGIKEGWYAIEHDGNLAFDPFSSREDLPKGNYSANRPINAD
jgi:hypothetical protein